MAERPITIDELRAINEVEQALDNLRFSQEQTRRATLQQKYERMLDNLIALARPDLRAVPFPPIPAAPPPGAAGETAAAPLASSSVAIGEQGTTLSSGGLITEGGLRDALHQMWADIRETHFQPSQHDWAEDCFAYLQRELDRQTQPRQVAA